MEYDDICSVCGTYCPEGGGIHKGCKDAIEAAVAAERERCAKLCECMHEEDRPGDYAWAIRTGVE